MNWYGAKKSSWKAFFYEEKYFRNLSELFY